MGIYSITSQGKSRTYTGLLADFIADGRVWQNYQTIAPSDLPGVIYVGDNSSTFTQLFAVGRTKRPGATAINTTAAGTSAAVLAGLISGLISSTSAAAVTLTLPTAVIIAAAFDAARGVSFDFVVDNSTGASAVTVAVAAGITVNTAVITGSDNLAVAVGKVGIFKIYFISATAAYLSRVQ